VAPRAKRPRWPVSDDEKVGFAAQVLPYAQAAELATGVLVSVILAQWANETDWGTSPAWVVGHNPAGISPGGVIARYPSVRAGVSAYIATMFDPDYGPVRAALGWNAQAVALGRSPWAAGHYDNGDGPGSSLVELIRENVLWLYDGPTKDVSPTKEISPDMLTSLVFAGQLHAFGVDTAGRLCHWWQNAQAVDGVFWFTEEIAAGVAEGQAPAAGEFGGQLHVFAQADDGTVCHAWQGPGTAWAIEQLALPANQPAGPAPAA